MPYSVYFNRVHQSARLHMSTCGYLKMHGGTSSQQPPTGWYRENINSLDEAEQIARQTGYDVYHCKRCCSSEPRRDLGRDVVSPSYKSAKGSEQGGSMKPKTSGNLGPNRSVTIRWYIDGDNDTLFSVFDDNHDIATVTHEDVEFQVVFHVGRPVTKSFYNLEDVFQHLQTLIDALDLGDAH